MHVRACDDVTTQASSNRQSRQINRTRRAPAHGGETESCDEFRGIPVWCGCTRALAHRRTRDHYRFFRVADVTVAPHLHANGDARRREKLEGSPASSHAAYARVVIVAASRRVVVVVASVAPGY